MNLVYIFQVIEALAFCGFQMRKKSPYYNFILSVFQDFVNIIIFYNNIFNVLF